MVKKFELRAMQWTLLIKHYFSSLPFFKARAEKLLWLWTTLYLKDNQEITNFWFFVQKQQWGQYPKKAVSFSSRTLWLFLSTKTPIQRMKSSQTQCKCFVMVRWRNQFVVFDVLLNLLQKRIFPLTLFRSNPTHTPSPLMVLLWP